MSLAHAKVRATSVSGATLAVDLIERVEHQSIANHSVRTYLYAVMIADDQKLTADADYNSAMLLHSCLLHDLGATDAFDGPSRFEVEGANAAFQWLEKFNFDVHLREQVWDAIALHTTPQIAENHRPITRLTRLGVRADFGDKIIPDEVRAAIELDFPRLDIERELSAVVVRQALRNRNKAPANSWAGRLLAAHEANPDDPDARLNGF